MLVAPVVVVVMPGCQVMVVPARVVSLMVALVARAGPVVMRVLWVLAVPGALVLPRVAPVVWVRR
ncbi:hypothetical protein NGTWS1702_38330 [Mycolicibacterium cyprinidarum]|uniref:Uncharacterized protein n=1 Tax=Mycolicibacterium cyprinidarum TaxID=2860311 RepID=A0ABQ4V7L6_9MYCO|nr:hypothetical protein NGTWS1702_38330 [Mycolicibacterium sp. NGTWSNA01]